MGIKALIHGTSGLPEGKKSDPTVANLKNANLFERGLVIDTISDVSLRDKAMESLRQDQKDRISLAPRNSIVCRLITTGDQLSSTDDIICYPFFSSHFALPVKVGEQVWVFRAKALSDDKGEVAYWVSRVSDTLSLEDVNFTPFTRSAATTGSMQPDRVLEFPNGNPGAVGGSLIDGDNNALKNVIQNSAERDQIKFEPIPRMTKRPGDLVIQGSNNVLISLGTDRGWDFKTRPNNPQKSNSTPDPENSPLETKSGAIDIVAGRGRYFDTDENKIKAPREKKTETVKNSTQPLIVKNTLEKFETDKNPAQVEKLENENDTTLISDHSRKMNPGEGDPDFLVDASRIYIAENTKIDEKLGTGGGDVGGVIPKGFAADFAPKEGAAIAVKSDHIRIIARKTKIEKHSEKEPEDPNFPDVNGSIRIIKEGNSTEDLAAIIIEPGGTIQISGSKIFLGRSPDDGGAGGGPGPDGEAQPYVKYQELEDAWKAFMDEMSTFCDTVLTHITPGYGAPSPQLNKAAADLKAAIAGTHDPAIETVKSERIFGE